MEKREKYINPFTDYGFKRLFGEEPNKDLLIDFLNEVLKGKEKIDNLTYMKTEKLGSRYSSRKAVFDLYCENENGEKIFQKLFKVAEIAKFTQAQLNKYEDSLKDYRDMYSVMKTQRRKGRDEERKIQEKKHYLEKIELAKKCIKKKMCTDDIIELTGLTGEQIKKIK